jgi:diguanylate cyclase (GGDEF)-like protein
LFLIVMATVFLGELAIMFALAMLRVPDGPLNSFADSLLLSALLFPVIYFAVVRPMLERDHNLEGARQALVLSQSSLETRIAERTEEITAANARLNQTVGQLHRRQQQLSILSEMTRLLQACDNLDEAFVVARTQLEHLLQGSSGALYLMNHSRSALKRAFQWGPEEDYEDSVAPQSCWALRCGRPLESRTGDGGIFCTHTHLLPEGSYSCIPLLAHGEALGTLLIHGHDDRQSGLSRRSDDPGEDVVFHGNIAENLALAISNMQLRDCLRNQALRDPMTGLYNRRYLLDTLEREFERTAGSDKPLSVILFDIDHFKKFNDLFGHDAGDSVLVAIGTLLRRWAEPAETCVRYGGEEFIVLLPGMALAQAAGRADDLRRAVELLVIPHQSERLGPISISAGVSTFPADGHDPASLIKAADVALYRAKSAGRNRVETASASDAGRKSPNVAAA